MQSVRQIEPSSVAPHFQADGIDVQIYEDMQSVAAIWQDFETRCVTTFYQTHAWCSCWTETVASSMSAKPLIVVARDSRDQVIFILPLQLRSKYGFVLLEWLTAPHAGYGYGLFDKNFLQQTAARWFDRNFDTIAAFLPSHDVLYLREMPDAMGGFDNPMANLARLRGANRSHVLLLERDFEALIGRKRSAETRRSMRKRDAKLASMGNIGFALPASNAEAHSALAEMFNDQEGRLAEAGVFGIYGNAERAFIHALMDKNKDTKPVLLPYCLTLDGRNLCVMLGGFHDNTYWALISSLAKGEARRHSPGDRALRGLIEALCQSGFDKLDFSAGDTAYKLPWTDYHVPLYLMLRTSSAKGLTLAIFLLGKHVTKRLLKQNPVVRGLIFTVRRLVKGSGLAS